MRDEDDIEEYDDFDEEPAAELGERDELLLRCPECHEPTDSLKEYRFVSWAVFVLIAAFWQTVHHRACPSCMRRFLGMRCLVCLVPANLLCLGLYPWALALIGASYQRGHSPSVLPPSLRRRMTGEEALPEDVTGHVVMGVLSLFVCWLPVVGIAFGLGAWIYNRRAPGWILRMSQAGFLLAVAANVAFVLWYFRWI